MSEKKKPRGPGEILRDIESEALREEIARIGKLSDEEVAAEIRRGGGDPDAIGERGASHVKKLQAQKAEAKAKRDAWQAEARKKLDASRAALAGPGIKKTRGLSREELVQRIEEKRKDPRLEAPFAVAFRKRTLDESSDAELEVMLDAIEALELLEDKLR